MKKLIRRLTAAMLCAILALAAPLAMAEDIPLLQGEMTLSAQLNIQLPDGSAKAIPVDTVVTSMGDTVFWVDESWFTPEEIEALASI